MKKILWSIIILLGISNFTFANFINNQKESLKTQEDNILYIYNTAYTHTWTKQY